MSSPRDTLSIHPPRHGFGRILLLILPVFTLMACSDDPVNGEWDDGVVEGLAGERPRSPSI